MHFESTAPRRRWGRWLARALIGGVLLVFLALLFWMRGGLYNRFILFPREAAAWKTLQEQRQAVTGDLGWQEFRGICHSHSALSHDCEVPFEEILRTLNQIGAHFICLSDHCDEGKADFSVQWRGLHEGKLFIPGFEMKDGFMPFGVKSDVVLTNGTPSAILARQIIDGGGVLFFAHPEETREWKLPELTGMEIYNIHSDFKRLPGGLKTVLPDVILSLRAYPNQIYHRVFHRPSDFLWRWDELNKTRDITGIAANDCHQNVGVRGVFTAQGTLRIEDTSPETLREIRLNFLTRPLARLLFGPLEADRIAFHVQLDPYERSGRFVNTHVLARELSEPEILDSLREGRVFVGFDVLADSTSFRWSVQTPSTTAVMGESLPFSSNATLHARSPVPCRFTLIRDGKPAGSITGREASWVAPAPGKYRVEAEVDVLGEWVPWVYANPIRLD
ncbi:MAG: hypothetical protein AB9869_38015 [Verrucomicrobiia bacterium]